MKKIFLTLTFITVLTSCSIHRGTLSSSLIDRTLRYEDIALGVSQTNTYFGIGGLLQDALILEAKRQLITNRPLEPGEQYANFIVDFKNSFYVPFYIQRKVTLSADVVRFTKDTVNDPYTEKYKTNMLGKVLSNDLFVVGDSVINSKFQRGIISSINNTGRARILYKTSKDNLRTKWNAIDDVYTLKKSYGGYKVGDYYGYNTSVAGVSQLMAYKIVALGLKRLIIKDKSSKLLVIKY